MRFTRLGMILFAPALVAAALQAQTDASNTGASRLSPSQAVDRVIQRERGEVAAMIKYHPMVETYLQIVTQDDDYQNVPKSDVYYLGRLDLTDGYHERFFLDVAKTGFMAEAESALSPMRPLSKVDRFWTIDYLPVGFAAMIFPDAHGFDRTNYNFSFVHREFLGDVRCMVFRVTPKDPKDRGRFLGRIWVEDQDYNIVRFNGVYSHPGLMTRYFHFDSWRANVQRSDLWLPSQVYSEESSAKAGVLKRNVHFKAQTRLWAYDLQHDNQTDPMTGIIIDPRKDIEDPNAKLDFAPVTSLREWQREAENNVLDRLEQAGLLAPAGSVDKLLQQIVTNVEAGNDIDLEPEIRCRVLLTAPLESASIGHTIVISRGLLDVVPDEASLAMVLTHELGHIVRGEQIDTKYSFTDRMEFSDNLAFQRFPFQRTAEQEVAADQKAIELLKKSIYGDKLDGAGLFLRQLQERASELPKLTTAHLGNGLTVHGEVIRMAALMQGAPKLEPKNLSQIAALPLGGRVKMDAWDDEVALLRTKPTPIYFASEKMPFEIAPAIMNLQRGTFSDAEGASSGK